MFFFLAYFTLYNWLQFHPSHQNWFKWILFNGVFLTNGEGNGNPLQYSCLKNPVDSGAWLAAICGVTQSWTRLKWLTRHVCIGEGNGNPLQCSCLENPRDGGAWWAAIYGVAQSRTRLKWLSNSSSSSHLLKLWYLRLLHVGGLLWYLAGYVYYSWSG